MASVLEKKISDWFITIPMATVGTLGILYLTAINSNTINPLIGLYLWLRAIVEDSIRIIKKQPYPPAFIYFFALLQWVFTYIAYSMIFETEIIKTAPVATWIIVDIGTSFLLPFFSKKASYKDKYVERVIYSQISLAIITFLYLFF